MRARCTITVAFAEPLYGDMNDTGLVWQRRLGDWWRDEKLRRAKRRLESDKQRGGFFHPATKSAASLSRA